MNVVSVQVSLAARHQHTAYRDGQPVDWTTGIYKQPVHGSVFVGNTNITGDGQGDLKNHGGRDKAVHMYPIEHYEYWRTERGLAQMTDGLYGENLTTRGLDESTACLGDEFEIGNCVLQISQPRVPCWKPARKFGVPDLAQWVIATGRTGWYARVLVEGTLQAGDAITLINRPQPGWTIKACNDVMHHMRANLSAARALASAPELADAWVQVLRRRTA